MDIGKIIIARTVIEEGIQEEFLKEIQNNDFIAEVEKKYTGFSSAEVTALLFNHSNFNEVFEHVVKYSDEPYYCDLEYQVMSQAVDVVKTVINVKGIMSEKNMKAAKLKALGYGLAVANFIKLLKGYRQNSPKSPFKKPRGFKEFFCNTPALFCYLYKTLPRPKINKTSAISLYSLSYSSVNTPEIIKVTLKAYDFTLDRRSCLIHSS